MSSISIDGLPEEEFRRNIESDLRHGREAAAAERLRALLAPYAAPGGILPERFLTIASEDLSLRGWEYLEDCIVRHDRPGRPVTALSIAFGWPGEDLPEVDAQGCLDPHIETGYFNDAAYPFSQSGRDDLLDGYSLHGCTWAADCEASDNALSLDGVADLSGALAQLEARLLASDEPDEEEIRAGSLGACLLSVLLFQAVAQKIASDGLPRPLCITAGSNGVYPYFDAPVVGMPEHVRRAAAAAEEEEDELDAGVPGPRYSSLLMTGIARAQKRAVLVLAESESETAMRIARLRGHGDGAADQPVEPAVEIVPEPEPEQLPEPANDAVVAQSPLMVKKPSGQSWDLRELLPPRPAAEPEAPPEPVVPHEPGGVFELLLKERRPEPAAPAEVPAATPAIAPRPDLPAEPGFPLLSPDLQQRLDSLLAPAPVEPSRSEPLAPKSRPWAPEQAGPVWPFGFDWDDAEVAIHVESARELADKPVVIQLRPSSLWDRLKAWTRPRRRAS